MRWPCTWRGCHERHAPSRRLRWRRADMKALSTACLGALCAFGQVLSVQATPTVGITFTAVEQYRLGTTEQTLVQQRLDQIEQQLRLLAEQSLQHGQQLHLAVHHVDLFRGSPQLALRYRLMAPDGQVVEVREAEIDDPARWFARAFGTPTDPSPSGRAGPEPLSSSISRHEPSPPPSVRRRPDAAGRHDPADDDGRRPATGRRDLR